jgi:polyketide synthase PksN
MQHKMLVPSIKADTVNPNINFDDTPFYLQRDLTEWKEPTANIDGFLRSIPGVLLSVLLVPGLKCTFDSEEYIPSEKEVTYSHQASGPQIVVLSAKNRIGLWRLQKSWLAL